MGWIRGSRFWSSTIEQLTPDDNLIQILNTILLILYHLRPIAVPKHIIPRYVLLLSRRNTETYEEKHYRKHKRVFHARSIIFLRKLDTSSVHTCIKRAHGRDQNNAMLYSAWERSYHITPNIPNRNGNQNAAFSPPWSRSRKKDKSKRSVLRPLATNRYQLINYKIMSRFWTPLNIYISNILKKLRKEWLAVGKHNGKKNLFRYCPFRELGTIPAANFYKN